MKEPLGDRAAPNGLGEEGRRLCEVDQDDESDVCQGSDEPCANQPPALGCLSYTARRGEGP